jgi:hypothetical protein
MPKAERRIMADDPTLSAGQRTNALLRSIDEKQDRIIELLARIAAPPMMYYTADDVLHTVFDDCENDPMDRD